MMQRRLIAALAATFALAACGGGGSTAPAGPPIPAASPVPVVSTAPTTAPQSRATFPMTIAIPRRGKSGSARSPQFVSPGLAALAFYDGATLIYVANIDNEETTITTVYAKSGNTSVTPGGCTFSETSGTCALTVTSTVGAHTFGLVAYPVSQGQQPTSVQRRVSDTGTPPAFTGVILSEGQFSVTLSPGTNPGQTLTMLGVADGAVIANATDGAYNTATTFGYRILDSANSQILTPGDYDNGPVTVTAAPAGLVTIAPNSFATPPSNVADQNFDVTCVNPAGGDVTISFNARTSPNTTYASGLTYSASNYAPAVIATTTFTCDPASATIPITVQGKHR